MQTYIGYHFTISPKETDLKYFELEKKHLRAYQTENGISACSERIDGTNDFG
jgi:hypothetical protein